MSIAIHIVTHNNETTITKCIESVLAQQVDLAIQIVDNASTDHTREIIGGFGLPVVRNSYNRGYAVAQNQALALTDSEYVLALNPDVSLEPGFLREVLAVLESDSRIGAAAGCLLRVDGLGDDPKCIDSAGLYMRRNRRQGLWCEGAPVSQRPLARMGIFGPDGAAAFYRRAMLEDLRVLGQIFDEDFFIQKEDVDICWRAQLRGWKAIYVPEAVASHIRAFRPGRRRRVDATLRYYAVRNRYLLLIKNETKALFRRDWPRIIGYDLGILLYLLVREPKSIKAFWSVWRLRRRLLQKRRIIQTGRRISDQRLAVWFRGPPDAGR